MLLIYYYKKLNKIKNNIYKNLLYIGKKFELIMYMCKNNYQLNNKQKIILCFR